MNELDCFLEYILDDIDSDNIHLYKRIKNGHKTFTLNISSETINKGINSYSDINIVIDITSSSLEITSSSELQVVTIESEYLVKKWSNVFEKYLSENLEKEVIGIIGSSFKNKSLLRDYKLTKIQ